MALLHNNFEAQNVSAEVWVCRGEAFVSTGPFLLPSFWGTLRDKDSRQTVVAPPPPPKLLSVKLTVIVPKPVFQYIPVLILI